MRKVIFEQARPLAAFTKLLTYSQYGQSLYEVVHILLPDFTTFLSVCCGNTGWGVFKVFNERILAKNQLYSNEIIEF